MKMNKWIVGAVLYNWLALIGYAGTYGDLTYTYSGLNKITITDCNESAKSVSIPEKINGSYVTAIGSSAFSGCSSLRSVSIPGSVTSIGNSAFYNTALMMVTIPDSVTSIGNSAFYSTDLMSVSIGNKVSSIGDSAFYECNSLSSVTIPDSVNYIGDSAFYSCSRLESVTIGNNVSFIGRHTFYRCESLTSVSIPSCLTSIGGYAFYSCSDLASIEIPDKVATIGESAFRNCDSLIDVTIPNSVTTIDTSAFHDCDGLTSVTLSSNITSIGTTAFSSCDALTNATFAGNAPNIFGTDVFSYCAPSFKVYFYEEASGFSSPTWNGYPCEMLDTDGMDNSWEHQIIDASNGEFTHVGQVMPEDDFDGDGSLNREEYVCGTDPTDPASAFTIKSIGPLTLALSTVADRTYTLETCSRLGEDWQPVATNLAGNGDWRTLTSIDLVASNAFFRGVLNQNINDADRLSGLAISGPGVLISGSSNTQYSCMATYADGTETDVTSNATWRVNSAAATLQNGTLTVSHSYTGTGLMLNAICNGLTTTKDVVLLSADMVLIPGGTNSGTDPDYGTYSLTVDSLYMDATEVTKAEWDKVYAWAITNGYSFSNAGSGYGSNHPVHTVNWYDCVKWCNARSEKGGQTPCYTVSGSIYKSGEIAPACNFNVNGYRLPTSVEWEYAARGGVIGKRFPWGDTISHDLSNYNANYDAPYDESYPEGKHPNYAETSPVGALAKNGYGIYDMAGNVMEWCTDIIGGSSRRIRGGSWLNNANSARCGLESQGNAGSESILFGFRTICR